MQKKQKYKIIIFLGVCALLVAGPVRVYQFFRSMAQGEGQGDQVAAATEPVTATTVAPNTNVATETPVAMTPALPIATIATTTAMAIPKARAAPPVISQTLPETDKNSLALSLNVLTSILPLLKNAVGKIIAPAPVITVTTDTTLAATTTVASPSPPPAPVATPMPVATTTPVAATTAPPAPTTTTLTQALPYIVNGFSDMAGWERTWGAVSVESSSLAVGAESDSSGGEAILTNASSWGNYLFTANVDWVGGQTFSLEAHRQDGNDYLSCEFLSDGEIFDYMMVNGVQTQLGQGMVVAFTPTKPVTASIQIDGNKIQCGLNGGVVPQQVYYGIPPTLASGTIGVLAWDRTPGAAQILVQSVSVKPL